MDFWNAMVSGGGNFSLTISAQRRPPTVYRLLRSDCFCRIYGIAYRMPGRILADVVDRNYDTHFST